MTALFQFETPAMETLDLARVYTRPINHVTAARMVETYHYAHQVPSVIHIAVGLYVDDVLAGCVTYGSPASPVQHRACGDLSWRKTLELNRLYIHDWAGRNCESYLIGRSFRILADLCPNYTVLLSYADSAHGHVGRVYQATNWLYTGTSREGCEAFMVGGERVHARVMNHRHGTSSVAKVQAIYPDARPVAGQAKHRYVFFLGDRRERRRLRKALLWPVLPYPKADEPAGAPA